MKKSMAVLVSLVAVFLLVPLLPAVGAEIKSAKDTLVIAVQQDQADHNPFGNTTNATVKIKSQVYETLIERTIENEFKPLLAESWKWSDDYLTLTVKLKKGILCHNGEELKAADCLFSLGIIRESGQRMATDYIDLEKSHVVDDHTFAIVLTQQYLPLVANLSYPPCVMFSKKGYEAAGGDWAKMDVGTGPYKWGEWVQGDHQNLVAFDKYHVKGMPYIKNVVFRVIEEIGNRYIEVETGGADAAYEVSGTDIPAIQANPNLVLYREYVNDNAYFGFNYDKAPFNDVRVRQAFAHAFDLQGAWKVSMNGIGRPAVGVLPNNIKDSVAGTYPYPKYEYNLEKARALLAEAGFPNGFECRMHVGNQRIRVSYGEFFQNALKQVGIKVTLISLDGPTNNQALKVERNFDTFMWGIAATNGDIDYANRYFYGKDTTQRNMTGYKNDELDAMIEAASREPDPAKRSELNAKIQLFVVDQVPIIAMYQQEDVYVHVKNLMGLKDGAYQSPLLKYCYFQ